jgi:hypothetical protein
LKDIGFFLSSKGKAQTIWDFSKAAGLFIFERMTIRDEIKKNTMKVKTQLRSAN